MATIKKAFQALHTALTALPADTTVEDILANPSITKLMEASKGGFSGVDSFVTIDGQKVARECAMLGAVFAHDNTDKDKSFFYKNGSYMIGAEIVKATARKEWEADRDARELELEEQMLEGDISPKEWKEAVTQIKAETFEWTIPEDIKAGLIETFDGYPTKEAFEEAYKAGTVAPFSDYAEETQALRDLAHQE